MSEEEKAPFDPYKELNSNLWLNMKLQDLFAQEILLRERIVFAQRIGNAPLMEQLERGMKTLQEVIKIKSKSNKGNSDTVIIQ